MANGDSRREDSTRTPRTNMEDVPMLFDVVIPGDYLPPRAARDSDWPAQSEAPPAATSQEEADAMPDMEAIEGLIESAIDAALPSATEAAVCLLREAIHGEIRRALGLEEEASPNAPPKSPGDSLP